MDGRGHREKKADRRLARTANDTTGTGARKMLEMIHLTNDEIHAQIKGASGKDNPPFEEYDQFQKIAHWTHKFILAIEAGIERRKSYIPKKEKVKKWLTFGLKLVISLFVWTAQKKSGIKLPF